MACSGQRVSRDSQRLQLATCFVIHTHALQLASDQHTIVFAQIGNLEYSLLVGSLAQLQSDDLKASEARTQLNIGDYTIKHSKLRIIAFYSCESDEQLVRIVVAAVPGRQATRRFIIVIQL